MKLLTKLLVVLFVVALASFTDAQVNKTVRFNESGTATKVIEWEFTLDSLAGFLSPEFTFDNFDGVDFNTYPITFKRNTVSTYGTPKLDIFLLGTYQSRTDTTALDSIAFQQTGEIDSTGILNLHGSNGIKPTRAKSYRLFARCLNADINSGKVTLIIPRKETE